MFPSHDPWGAHWHFRLLEPKEKFLTSLLKTIQILKTAEYLTYAVVSQEATKEGLLHIHAAFGSYRSVNKFSLAAKLKLRGVTGEFRQYYLAPIYKESSPASNAEYVKKGGNILFESGEVPDTPVERRATEAATGQKSQKWKDMIKLAKAQEWEILEEQYPYEFITNGAKLKALYFIQHLPKDRQHNQHMWIYGPPGTGKSAIVEVLYPNNYKKRPDNDWLGYNPTLQTGHQCVYLGDFDLQSMKTLKPENLKLMCDPQGFNANKKFGGGEIVAPGRVVVTSNFKMGQCFIPGTIGIETQKAALRRRFRMVHIDELLKELGLKLKPKEELEQLKKEGNFDYSKCFTEIPKTETIDLTKENPIDQKVREVIDLTNDNEDDFITNSNRLRGESFNVLTPKEKPPATPMSHVSKKRKKELIDVHENEGWENPFIKLSKDRAENNIIVGRTRNEQKNIDEMIKKLEEEQKEL